jgi:hypothetical protein
MRDLRRTRVRCWRRKSQVGVILKIDGVSSDLGRGTRGSNIEV